MYQANVPSKRNVGTFCTAAAAAAERRRVLHATVRVIAMVTTNYFNLFAKPG